MALTKTQKGELLTELKRIFTEAPSLTFVHYEKLSVGDADALRGKLASAQVKYKVVKKTILKRALEEAGFSGAVPELGGEVALAWSTVADGDPTEAAREVYEFHQSHQDQLWIIGGVYDQTFQNAEEMNEIATIPDIKTLRGMFVNVINSPIQGFASVLHQIAEKQEA